MLRVLATVLLALAPFANAYPAEWPVSEARVGRAAQTASRTMRGAAGDDRFLVTWTSVDRGGQAAVIALDGTPLGDTSIALPLTPYGLFWRDGAWTILGHAVDGWAWVRVSREGVLLDRVPRPLAFSGASFDASAWTGSALIVAGRGPSPVIEVRVFDENLEPVASHAFPIADGAWSMHLASDGQTALLTVREWSLVPKPPLRTFLFDAQGALLRTKDVEDAGSVRAIGSSGNGNGYVLVTNTSASGTGARFGTFRLDHQLVKRSVPAGFGPGTFLFDTAGTLTWDGSAFLFFYRPEGHVRMARLSAAGGILDDGVVLTSGPTLDWSTGLAGVSMNGQSLLLFTRGEGLDYGEPHFLRVRAGHDAAGLAASEEHELERGAFQQVRPAAASNATQSLIAWRERNSVTAPHLLYATRVDAAGNVRDPQSLFLGALTCKDMTPSVATNGDSFLVTWYDDSGVAAVRIGADGSVGEKTRVQFFRQQPCVETQSLALSNGTDYLVVWRRNDDPRDVILGARISGDGTLLDTEPIDIGTATAAGAVAGASNGTDYLLAWDGRMMRIAANGTRLDSKPGPHVLGTGTGGVWWNGQTYSLLQYVTDGFKTLFQVAHVSPSGAITIPGEPSAFPVIGLSWGGSNWHCDASGCTVIAGTIDDGRYFLHAIEVGSDHVLRAGTRTPVEPVLRREWEGGQSIVPFGVPGGRPLVAMTRYSLDDPYDGISRIFIHPLTGTRGRAVRH